MANGKCLNGHGKRGSFRRLKFGLSGYAEVLIDLSESKLHMENVELTLSLMNFDCNYFALYELEVTLLDITILHCTTN